MSDLEERFVRLGLSQYLEVFVSEGFDTWDTVLDITESDLSSLGVKLGHRRKLQRAIAESRGQSSGRPLPIALRPSGSNDGPYRSDDSATEGKARQGDPSATSATTTTKRKYRRHPKHDEYAPERPPSAYVLFSNQLRETLKGKELSFTEIAKAVGERWQVVDPAVREACERKANAMKQKYHDEMKEYRQTPHYEAYQKYLAEFKAKHAAPPKGKRSKVEPEAMASAQSSSNDQAERTHNRRASAVHHDNHPGRHVSDPSVPTVPQLKTESSHPGISTSPAVHSRSGFNSPRLVEHNYSPLSASPRSAASLHKENSFESQTGNMPRDARAQPPYSHAPSYPPSTAPTPATNYSGHYQAPIDLPSRRSNREMTRLPMLSHEDTTLSSESGHGGYVSNYTGQTLPVIDTSKSMRMLPAPVPSMAATPSPLDRPPGALLGKSPGSQHHQDYRTNASLAALLRAGELARVADADADDEEMDTSPPYQ